MIVLFPREHQPHIEVFSIRDRSDGRLFHVFELVGRDAAGPYRVDMAHRYTTDDFFNEVQLWWREGIEVQDVGVLL